jgi:hypothetical protein
MQLIYGNGQPCQVFGPPAGVLAELSRTGGVALFCEAAVILKQGAFAVMLHLGSVLATLRAGLLHHVMTCLICWVVLGVPSCVV